MAYTTHVRVIQTKPSSWYSVVEKTTWDEATWRECDGEHLLHMNASGTSGTLRFNNAQSDYFLVALGVHNYKRWCDIVPNLASSNTGAKLHPAYYGNGPENQMLWKQLAHLEKTTSKGVKITVDYYKEDGNTLWATITIA